MTSLAHHWKAEGIQQGIAKGMHIGRNEGKYERTVEVAKNLLAQNIDIKTISVATGLTVDEINKLKNS